MATSPITLIDDNTGDETSNSELSISSSSFNTSSPKTCGRNRNYIWSHFIDEGEAKTGGYRKARCRYCKILLSYAKIPMMYNHIAGQCDALVIQNPTARIDTIAKLTEIDQQNQSPKSAKRLVQLYDASSTKKQMKMDQYGSRILSPNEKLDIDRTLLKALIMNSIPFQIVTSAYFLDLIQKLNPSYCPPDKMKLTRQTLMNELLYVEKMNDSILTEASYLTLNLDGWTDQSHRSLYEFNVITENRRAVVLSLVDLSAYSHTAEFLLERLEIVLRRASTTFNIAEKIVAIVTDNPNVMEKLRNLFIAKPAYRHILDFRCFAHAINLIAVDVVKHSTAFRIISKITTITSYSNHSHAFKAKLKEESMRLKCNKETLDTIVVTRWTSVADCLRSFLLLKTPLQMMVSIEKDNLPAKIVNIISHRTFFTDIEQLYSIMKVLSYAVTLIQSRGATLADCHLVLAYLYVITNDFSSQCDYVDFNRYVSKVAKIRLKEFQNPFYLTCFYLHPKYRGAGLLSESRSTVYRCIAEYSKLIGNNSSVTKNVIGALQRYEIKAGPYSLIYSKGDTPSTWWCMIRDHTHGSCLQQIALRFLSITPHSVMPERLFSILSWQHSKRRNRLSPFTLEAIAKIHTFYKHNSEDTQVDINIIEDALGEEIRSDGNLSDTTMSNTTADEFQRTMSEYQEILQEMAQSDVIDMKSVDDNDLLHMEKTMNKDDQDLHAVFVEAGLFDQPDKSNFDEEQEMTECDEHVDDYDVD
ncbi:unnamed protein product, partial [Adineta ricciae]